MSPLEAVENWVRQVVVGQNLCPFAGKPLVEGHIFFVEIPERKNELVLESCHSLLTSFCSTDQYETALLVLPKGYEDFMNFLDLADALELMLEDIFDCELSLATFHPKYQFAEFDATAIVHHIHRSPYPILHILRENSIEEVRTTLGNTSTITDRNQKHAESLGLAFFEKFLP